MKTAQFVITITNFDDELTKEHIRRVMNKVINEGFDARDVDEILLDHVWDQETGKHEGCC